MVTLRSGLIYVNDQLMLIQSYSELIYDILYLYSKKHFRTANNHFLSCPNSACVHVNTHTMRSCTETHLHLHLSTYTLSVSHLQQKEFKECFAGIYVPIQKHLIKLLSLEIKYEWPLRILGKLKMLILYCFFLRNDTCSF